MSKYFVTGISGFCAPHLAKLLIKEGHKVHALIRASNGREYDLLDIMSPEELHAITFHYGDLKDYRSLERIFEMNEFDGVFHLGAQSHPPTSFIDPIGTFETNVMGTLHLIQVTSKYQKNCPFMFCSTSEVYGDSCKEVGVLEETLSLQPSNPYGTSKAAIDLLMRERCNNGYLTGYITRAFSHTGSRRGKNFSISWDAYHLATMIVGVNKDRILPVGNLKTRRIVVDARDMVKAYYQLMLNYDNGEAYNVCGPVESVKEMGFFTDTLINIAKLRYGLIGVTKKIDKRVYRPIDIQVQIGSTAKLIKKVGWKPEISIETTLTDLLEYWVKKLR